MVSSINEQKKEPFLAFNRQKQLLSTYTDEQRNKGKVDLSSYYKADDH